MSATVSIEIAVLGVDEDCGHCAGEGLDRLKEAAPEIEWDRVLHDVRHTGDLPTNWYPPYWCDFCKKDADGS